MSFLGSLFSAAAPIIGGFLGGPVGAAIGGQIGSIGLKASQANQIQRAQLTQASALSSFAAGPPFSSLTPPLVPVAQVSPQGAQIGRAFGATIPGAAGAACPVGFHLDKRSRSRCVRNRRMNPLNGRAAMRAIRRIKGARKMLQKIERQLPRAKARRTPAHGHRVSVKAT